MMFKKENRKADETFVYLFIFFLAFILMGTFLGPRNEFSYEESRRLAQFPDAPKSKEELLSYPAKFDTFYRDNFGFRKFFIKLNKFLSIQILGKKLCYGVLAGEDGWLFSMGAPSLKDISAPPQNDNINPLRLAQEIVKRENTFLSLHIPYVFILAPDKQSIYPEHLPREVKHPRAKTRADFLVENWEKFGCTSCIDLRRELLQAKEKETRLLYSITGSHWNSIGALHAYQAIAKFLAQKTNVSLFDFGKIQFKEVDTPEMDLANMLGLPSKGSGYIPINIKQPCKRQLPSYASDSRFPVNSVSDCETGSGTLLLLGDSYLHNLFELFVSTFKRVVFISPGPVRTEDLLEIYKIEKPTLIIDERLERGL